MLVQKWGNSLAVRIPKPFAEDVSVREGSELDLSIANGALVAKPVNRRRPRLKDLLAEITEENLHPEVGAEGPVGDEAF